MSQKAPIYAQDGSLEVQPFPLVELHGISKYFGSLRANHDITMSITPGRVKALLGENGAGKSTLMSILSGRLQPDAGRIVVDGGTVRLESPRDAHGAGIGMVYQHFMLVDSMTVAENVLLGTESAFILKPEDMRARVRELSEKYGLPVEPAARVRTLSMGERQRVEILKLLTRESRVLIFDEPTAVLTPTEVRQLFAAMRRMAAQGKAIVFISHKLPEVLEIADEVAILRRGEVVDEFERKAVPDEAELARRMLGRELPRGKVEPDAGAAKSKEGDNSENTTEDLPDEEAENQLRLAMGKLPLNLGPGKETRMDRFSTVLELKNVNYKQLRDVSFSVLKGDILAVVGVAGNGQKELVELVCGIGEAEKGAPSLPGRIRGALSELARGNLRPLGILLLALPLRLKNEIRQIFFGPDKPSPESGTASILGQPVADFFRSPELRGGLSYIPEDRKGMAAAPALNLVENFLVTTYKLYSGRVMLDRQRARRVTEQVISDYSLYPPNWRAKGGELSGGNLQKLIVGRELMRNPSCIVAENPTQGLDIAATEEVWKRLKIARDSAGVLLVTGDVNEALALADHIAVIYRGRIVDIFGASNSAKVADIGLMMAGSKS